MELQEREGRVVVITGAANSNGICSKTCRTFIEREPECQIVVLDILDDRANEWISEYDNVSYFHTVGVAGSNPVAPTIELPGQKLVFFWLFCFAPSFDFFSGLSLVIRGIMSCLFSFPF